MPIKFFWGEAVVDLYLDALLSETVGFRAT